MTQKIFDTDNAEDMALLWSILPEDIEEICVENGGYIQFCYKKVGPGNRSVSCLNLIQINWHDKTEITRPFTGERV